jgi:hypothetical protein
MRNFQRFSNQDCGRVLTQRAVTRLVHITKFENLSRILEEGLSPSVHFSIQYPNVPLFVKKRSREYLAILVSPLLASREDADFTQSTSVSPREILFTGVHGIKTLFHQEVTVFGLGKLIRDANHPSNMPTSLMAEVIFRRAIPPSGIVSLVFSKLESVMRYEYLHGSIPKRVHWKTDQELSKEDKVFAFWKDGCDSMDAYEWIHRFVDHARRPSSRLTMQYP